MKWLESKKATGERETPGSHKGEKHDSSILPRKEEGYDGRIIW